TTPTGTFCAAVWSRLVMHSATYRTGQSRPGQCAMILGTGRSVHQHHHRIVDHVRSDARAEAASNFEKQGIEQADGSYGQPGDGRMVDGKENRIAQQCLPTSPFTVEHTVEQAAKQILFGEWSDSDSCDGEPHFVLRVLLQVFGILRNLFRSDWKARE